MISATEITKIITASDKDSWDYYYERLPPELRDINYSYDYNFLYEKNGDGVIRLFVFQKDEQLYFYPFLLRNISIGDKVTEFKDIETVYGYTGPVSTTNDTEFVLLADNAFCEYCEKENIITEFIRFNPLLRNERTVNAISSITTIALRDYVVVDLKKNEDEIFSSYTGQNRNKIRKAEKAGVQIEYDPSCKRFDDFVSIYLGNMKRLQAASMYFFTPAFYEGLKELTLKNGILINAMIDGETVGSTVFLKGSTYGHYFLSSANEKGKTNAVSNLMLHHGILWAGKNGLSLIHLGGGVSADESDPLLVFKKNFSEETRKFFIGKRIHNKKAYEMIVGEWDKKFPVGAMKYKSILQRYRFKEGDMS